MKPSTDIIKAGVFIEELRNYEDKLTRQEYLSMREMARSGDLVGAKLELCKVMMNKANDDTFRPIDVGGIYDR